MPKRLDPKDAKPFQPIKEEFLRDALSDAPPQLSETERRRETVVDFPGTQREELDHDAERSEEPGKLSAPIPGRLTRVLKAKISSSEQAKLNDLVNQLARELDTPVSMTHVIRALITILRNAESKVLQRARQAGPLTRPANDDLAGIAAFEFRLAKLLAAGLRDAPPLRELPRE